MKTHPAYTATYGSIKMDYSIIHNVEEYVDVDLYVSLDHGGEYLVRIFQELGSDIIAGPEYRYAPSDDSAFDDIDSWDVPKDVEEAVDSVLGHIKTIIAAEVAARISRIENLAV